MDPLCQCRRDKCVCVGTILEWWLLRCLGERRYHVLVACLVDRGMGLALVLHLAAEALGKVFHHVVVLVMEMIEDHQLEDPIEEDSGKLSRKNLVKLVFKLGRKKFRSEKYWAKNLG